jgi:hypothetical protein
VSIRATPSGHPTALLEGVFLHSRYDPPKDAAALVEREVVPAATAIILFGFGLGYGAEAARARYPDLPILVVEPDAEVFDAALSCRDLTRLFSDPKVSFHLEERPEGLAPLLELLPLARPGILRLRPAIERNPGRYRAAEETLHSWLLRRDINVNTLKRFGRLWVRNLCRNLPELLGCPGVAGLAGKFDGVPALVVAGGPSLDEVLPRLPELRERLLLVSVNTPLKPCLEAGAEPDFTVVVDPQYWASRYLDWTTVRRCMFVAEPSTSPRVFRRHDARFYLCSSLFPLGEILEAAVGEKGRLGAGGSVATSAWDLARLLGAHPLYAAGLDLGFPSMRTHCRGVYLEDLWFSSSDRLAPVEDHSFRSLRDIGLFLVRSTDGGTTPTDRRMLLYKWWFENQLRMHPELASYTLSPGGTAVEGMRLAAISDVLSLPVIRPEIDRRMEEVRGRHREDAALHRSADSLHSGLQEIVRQLDALEGLSRRGLALSRELGAVLARRGDPVPCVEALDGVDRGILECSARTVAGFLIQSVIHGIAGEGERKATAAEIVARSVAMYEGIAESARWQRDLLGKAGTFLDERDGFFS